MLWAARSVRSQSFERENLISAWFALAEEEAGNGALWFVPGSHRVAYAADRFDAGRFFRVDGADNLKILQTAVSPRLMPGDAVFFHCNTLHCVGQNQSVAVKRMTSHATHRG
jgi:phytanoyl-CoA hydroxylase